MTARAARLGRVSAMGGGSGVGLWSAIMKPETRMQLGLAVLGVPAMLLFVWKPDAKWPNPFLRSAGAASTTTKDT